MIIEILVQIEDCIRVVVVEIVIDIGRLRSGSQLEQLSGIADASQRVDDFWVDDYVLCIEVGRFMNPNGADARGEELRFDVSSMLRRTSRRGASTIS